MSCGGPSAAIAGATDRPAAARAATPGKRRRVATSFTVLSIKVRRGEVLANQGEIVATVEFAATIGLFPLLADQVGALLGIGRTQRGIIVDTVLLEIVQ